MLSLAAQVGDEDLARFFFEKGVDKSLKDETGDDALACAKYGGNESIIKMLS